MILHQIALLRTFCPKGCLCLANLVTVATLYKLLPNIIAIHSE